MSESVKILESLVISTVDINRSLRHCLIPFGSKCNASFSLAKICEINRTMSVVVRCCGNIVWQRRILAVLWARDAIKLKLCERASHIWLLILIKTLAVMPISLRGRNRGAAKSPRTNWRDAEPSTRTGTNYKHARFVIQRVWTWKHS